MEPLKNIDEMLVKLGEGVPPRTMSYKQALSLSAEYGGEDIDQAKAKIKNIEKAFNELEAQRVRLDHEETELQNEYEQVQAEFIEIMQDIKDNLEIPNPEAAADKPEGVKEATDYGPYEATDAQLKAEKEIEKQGFRFSNWIPAQDPDDEDHGIMVMSKRGITRFGKEYREIDVDGAIN